MSGSVLSSGITGRAQKWKRPFQSESGPTHQDKCLVYLPDGFGLMGVLRGEGIPDPGPSHTRRQTSPFDHACSCRERCRGEET